MSASPKESIGSIIKEMRKKRFPGHGGIKKCAESFGVNYQQWRDWESGKSKPGTDYRQKLAEFFDTTVDEFRSEKTKKPPAGADGMTDTDKAFIEHCLHIQRGIAELASHYLSQDEDGKAAIREQMGQVSQALLDQLGSAEG